MSRQQVPLLSDAHRWKKQLFTVLSPPDLRTSVHFPHTLHHSSLPSHQQIISHPDI